MKLNNRAQNCAECEFMRMYDYGNRIYYCDHADRIDDMGKLSVGELPKESPEWCPVQGTAYTVTKYTGWIKPDAVATYADINNPHNVTKEQIGLI